VKNAGSPSVMLVRGQGDEVAQLSEVHVKKG
jgi:hypothetical protein